MKLDEQVTSLELSKRLRALGAPQTSVFFWVETKKGDANPLLVGPNAVDIPDADFYSAFTVAELGALIPYSFVSERRASGRWECGQRYHLDVEGSSPRHPFADVTDVFFGNTEVEVRAKTLIFVLEASSAAGSGGTGQ
jgi:hypothetical protein